MQNIRTVDDELSNVSNVCNFMDKILWNHYSHETVESPKMILLILIDQTKEFSSVEFPNRSFEEK